MNTSLKLLIWCRIWWSIWFSQFMSHGVWILFMSAATAPCLQHTTSTQTLNGKSTDLFLVFSRGFCWVFVCQTCKTPMFGSRWYYLEALSHPPFYWGRSWSLSTFLSPSSTTALLGFRQLRRDLSPPSSPPWAKEVRGFIKFVVKLGKAYLRGRFLLKFGQSSKSWKKGWHYMFKKVNQLNTDTQNQPIVQRSCLSQAWLLDLYMKECVLVFETLKSWFFLGIWENQWWSDETSNS